MHLEFNFNLQFEKQYHYWQYHYVI